MNKTDEQLVQQTKRAFDQSVDGLDAATLSRLNRGRQTALAGASRPGREISRWMPAAGMAAVVLMAVVMLRSPDGIDSIDAPVSDFEILLSEDSIDMYEDLEFYSWLDTQEFDAEGEGDFG